jgi:plasmid stabilization system protein ParE
MIYKIVITKPAETDIEQNFMFINLQSPAAAIAWLGGIQQIIESLNKMPSRGAPVFEKVGLKFEYRHLLHHNHRIVFRVEEATKTVFVVRVYHSSRMPLRIRDVE